MAQGSALIAALRSASPANEAQPQSNSFQTMSFPWQQNTNAPLPSFTAPVPKVVNGPSIADIRAGRMARAQENQLNTLTGGNTGFGSVGIGGGDSYYDNEYYDPYLDMWVSNPEYEQPTYQPPAPTYQPPAPTYQEPAYEPPQQTYEKPVYDEMIEPEWYYDPYLDMWVQQ
jgi:hypothetical protein